VTTRDQLMVKTKALFRAKLARALLCVIGAAFSIGFISKVLLPVVLMSAVTLICGIGVLLLMGLGTVSLLKMVYSGQYSS